MFDSPLSASAYEVLGVAPDADEETLRRGYRLKLRQTHPDTGGDAVLFVQVQRAWELVGTASARAAYDAGHGFGSAPAPEWTSWQPRRRPADTRPGPRTHGHPGGRNRERYLAGMREWVGRGVELTDPYDPALVRGAPAALRHLLADALAEESTARTVADLGMGYTLWHDVAAPHRGDHDAKLDHIVLGPSGLYGVASEDFGGPVRVKRGELVGEDVGTPIAALAAATRAIARAAGVRFSGHILVLPDDDVPELITELGKVRSLPTTLVGRSALATVLRRGVAGARDIGGTEVFDVRTRLQRVVAFA